LKNFINFLTVSRLLSGPIIFVSITFFNYYLFALILFLLSAITDFFDGFLARKYYLVSSFGEMLDPIADKVLLLFLLFSITLITQDFYIGMMSSLIISREIFVGGLREFTSKNNISSATEVTFLAKVKTSIQFITISSYLVSFLIGSSILLFISSFLLFISLLVTFKTGLDYFFNTIIKSK
tara:strand:+ start:1810 stop:2352 length:543 start_codon:yes stop_codon:yes gene_type:complete